MQKKDMLFIVSIICFLTGHWIFGLLFLLWAMNQ